MIEETAGEALQDHAETWSGHVHDLIASGMEPRLQY